MSSRLYVLAKLYGPIVVSVIFLVAAVTVPPSDAVTTIELQPIELFSIDIPLPSTVILKAVLLLACIGALGSFLVYDYTAFFPQHLKMEVFFDNTGINRSVSALKLARIGVVASDYLSHRAQYFAAVDAQIAALGYSSHFFAETKGAIHSKGHTSFVVEPVSGWQRYRVVEATGELEHTLEMPGASTVHLLTIFEKTPSGDDYFSVSWSRPFQLVLKSRFKQMLASDRESTRSTFRFVIVGLTVVRIWPWPSFSNTVYCADFEGVGLVPVAYAVYR